MSRLPPLTSGSCCNGTRAAVWELTNLDAELPELDKDVGTGNEGDVEARCFSTSPLLPLIGHADIVQAETPLATS